MLFDWFGGILFDAIGGLISTAIWSALSPLFVVNYWAIFTGWFGL